MEYKIQHVAVGCDLSHNAFEYALNIAKENDLGKFQCLLVSPEDKFIAKTLLQDNSYAVVYFFHPESIGKWIAIFEHGIVIGQAE